jgi:GDP-4-dehydro-6-deoxy-D-mannose reductase
MKKILITGINGFVGSHLADLLIRDKNNKVFGVKKPNGRLEFIRNILNNITLFDGDITDPHSIEKIILEIQPDRIYHLAALSWVDPSWNMPAAYMQVNAIGTIHLLEAVKKLKKIPRVLVSCTPEEFGDVPESKLPITEETKIAPLNPYAASKVAQDVMCQVYFASYNIPIIRTRAFNHEGPRRDIHGALASFAFQIAKIEAGKQKPVIYVGNLEARRNFTDVRDMVKAYNAAMENCNPGELYLIGTDQIYTIKECLEKLISLSTLSKKITYKIDPKRVRLTELRRFVGDFTKFTKKTGWKPTIKFEDTLNDILEYWRKQVKLLE